MNNGIIKCKLDHRRLIATKLAMHTTSFREEKDRTRGETWKTLTAWKNEQTEKPKQARTTSALRLTLLGYFTHFQLSPSRLRFLPWCPTQLEN
jgi:hypothetical protein